MKLEYWIAGAVLLWAWDAHNRSQQGNASYMTQFQQQVRNFQALEGTNFTNSLWDPVSGQPAYMFGTINAPGGDSVMGTPSYTGAFGHM
ncbi:hypothetical protein PWR66_07730 [Paraburkholderia sp. A1RO-5]|uniref:hypothetical protein n=1 Tax=Paraburkholderia sp. A1RO-5 TaxID=3028369 RepID=UPI003B7F9CD6